MLFRQRSPPGHCESRASSILNAEFPTLNDRALKYGTWGRGTRCEKSNYGGLSGLIHESASLLTKTSGIATIRNRHVFPKTSVHESFENLE